jgi:hypothetical protein
MYTLQGKTRPTRHVCFPLQSTHAWRMLSAGSLRTWQPFTGSHEVKIGPLHPEEVLATKDRLAQPSSWVTSFLLPCDSPGVGERGFDTMVTQLHQFTGLISPACDRYVQYLLAGANWMVLNRHRRGLQPWRCRLATYPLPDLSNQQSLLSPNGPARYPV